MPVTTKEFVVVLLVARRLVATAFVVVELPTMRSVMLAKVATSDEKKPLVEVLLTEVRSVKLPLVAEKLVVKKLVEELLSATRLVT